MNDKDLEKLHNKHATALRQEYNAFNAEMKKRFDGIDELITEKVRQEVSIHLELISQAVQAIEAKLQKHFGR